MELLLFGAAVWFWVLFGIFFIILISAEAKENGFISFVALLAFLAVIYFWGKDETGATDGWTWLKNLFTWTRVLIYLGIGLIFAYIRFFFYGREKGDELKRLAENFAKKKGNLVGSWLNWDKNTLAEFKKESYEVERLMSPTDLKGHAFRWWFNWPGSLVWWIFDDMLRNLWNWVYDFFKKGFQRLYEAGLRSAQR